MNFFEYQEQARRQSRWLVFLFILAVITIIVVIDVAVLVAFGVMDTEQQQGLFNIQTFKAMIVPNQAPMPMTAAPGWKVKAAPRMPIFPRIAAPDSQVATAAQRNQSNAGGAIYLLIAPDCLSKTQHFANT